ncbi:hypothetical protein [Streptomyces caatingaensis]|uniref:Secreted protein n=1 Tax=Streptomyces caatingaensis TaxID=1678637 RepID=A0A0K9XID8_9ACTN|nr:hypothetical protein [Streptomyces caatingaensis]KNB53145.1 hypothetical protein AC230_06665 [Streptomyces caatingaensis]
MRIRHRVATAGLVLALAGGGAVGVAAPASASGGTAASAFSCDAWQYRRSSTQGHGASITCHGRPFVGYVVCHQPDGHAYLRLGNRARSGGTSVAWCDRNAEVREAGALPF